MSNIAEYNAFPQPGPYSFHIFRQNIALYAVDVTTALLEYPSKPVCLQKEDVLSVKLMVHGQIEELRIQMQEIASDKDLTDPRVVRVSERLDILINAFLLAKNGKKGVLEGLGKIG